MTPEDRQAIEGFFARMRQVTTERDPEAERLIAELMQRDPQTKYYITQMAFFQEHALAEAQNRIRELEAQLQQRGSGGFLGGLFGGGRPTGPLHPVHAPGYRPGMFNQQQGGFLGTMASTAVGVMGGLLLGSALASMLGIGEAAAAEAPAEEVQDDSEDFAVEDVGFDEE